MERLKGTAAGGTAPFGKGLSSLTSRTDWIVNFRPVLPSNAGPLVGCLLLHMTARSYGANHTQRLCRAPLLVMLADTSSALRPSPQLSLPSPPPPPTPNDFRRRTYLNIHSPTIVCAIASTTLVCCNTVVDAESRRCVSWEWPPAERSTEIFFRPADRPSRGAVMLSYGMGGAAYRGRGLSGLYDKTDVFGDRLLDRSASSPCMTAADRTLRSVGRRTSCCCWRPRSEKFLVLDEAVGLGWPSLPLNGAFLELSRMGTGNGGAMLDAPLPLSTLGKLGLRARVRWCAAAPLEIIAARRMFGCLVETEVGIPA